MDSIIISGWLEKKKKATSKAVLSAKYQKRWFELTADTLAYAKDPQELKEDRIEVFAAHEMVYVKRVDEIRLEMKFPERVLRVKAPSPGEADKWHAALEKVHKDKQTSPGVPSQRTVDVIRKSPIITAFTIEADSDDDDGSRAPAVPTPTKPKVPPPPLRAISPPKPERESFQLPERLPSPRSLLANPRMGNMMISTPTKPNASDSDDNAEHDPVQTWDAGSGDDQPAESKADSRRRGGAAQRLLLSDSSSDQGQALPTPELEEAPIRRHLPSTLRSSVVLQDEAAPALRGSRPESPGDLALRASSNVGRTSSSFMPPMEGNPAYSYGSPSASSIGPLRRPQSRGDVVTLEPGRSSQPLASSSRPGSNASSRFSNFSTGERPASRPMAAQDERLELMPVSPMVAQPGTGRPLGSRAGSAHAPRPPAAPSTGAARGHSAGSSTGQTTVTASARVQSANSSIGPGPSAAEETEEGEHNWDSWDESSEEEDDDSAMAHARSRGAAAGAGHAGQTKQKQQRPAALVDGNEDERHQLVKGMPPRPPVASRKTEEIQQSQPFTALRPDANFVDDNWDSD